MHAAARRALPCDSCRGATLKLLASPLAADHVMWYSTYLLNFNVNCSSAEASSALSLCTDLPHTLHLQHQAPGSRALMGRWTAELSRLEYQRTPQNEALLAGCPQLTTRKFAPLWYLCNGLLQTFQATRATVKERHPSIPYERQLLNMPDGGGVSLDWALPSDIDSETAEGAPLGLDAIQHGRKTALLIAGLTGGSYEHYMRCAVWRLTAAGWQCVVLNSRGCADTPLQSQQFYCNAYTEDLRFVAKYLVDEYAFGQKEAFLGVGFSMGANVLTKYLGEQGTSSALTAGVSVGNPFDLTRCFADIRGSIYDRALSKRLRALVFEKSNAHEVFKDYPGVDMAALRLSTLVYDFDELFTIKLFRYSTVDEFYVDASSVTRLAQVRVPLLCLSAADDPICVPAALPTREQVEANPHVILCVAKSGGHLGFFESGRRPDEPKQVDKTQETKWSERVWSARVIAEFAESVVRNLHQ